MASDYYVRQKTLYRFTCEICVERKRYNNCFGIKGCNHYYCSDCIRKYINSKLDDNVVHIDCPVSGCPGLLDPDHCRSIIAHQVFDRWGSALREASIPHARKFYCPYKDCSALLLLTDDDHGVTRSECPYCQRFLCVQCRCEWHDHNGIDCNEFQKSKKADKEENDMLLHQIAEKRRWRQCPQCNIYIVKTDGCHITRCRCCSCRFCYRCGLIIGDPKGHLPMLYCNCEQLRTTTSEKSKDTAISDSKSSMRTMRIKITDSYGTREIVHEFYGRPARKAPQPSSNINGENINTLEDID